MEECAVILKKTCTELQELKLVIAGGGTGGHCNPAVAVIEELNTLSPLKVLWIGTGRDAELRAIKDIGCEHKILQVSPMQGVGPLKKLYTLFTLPEPIFRAATYLLKFKPDIVFGVGSYVSGPVIVASWLLNIPCAIQEQNVVPGTANRLSAKFAKRIFVTFEDSIKYFPEHKCVVTGNPIRKRLLSVRPPILRRFNDPPILLIVGGSQGSREVNKKGAQAVVDLWEQGLHVKVIHQTGSSDYDFVMESYKKAVSKGFAEEDMFEVYPYIQRMEKVYSQADLVLCRAGASTIAELTAIGLPSILIPFPHAAERHQELNAELLVKKGAAIMTDSGPLRLSNLIKDIIFDPDKLKNMAQAALELGKKDAARQIALQLLEMGRKGEVTV